MSAFVFLLITIVLRSSGSFSFQVKDLEQKAERRDEQILRAVQRTTQHNFVNPAVSTFPTTTPVTNPVTVTIPPDTSTPGTVATPSFTPVSTPITNPANPALPITNPVTTPSTTFPGGQPNNPSITYPAPMNSAPATTTSPSVAQPVTTNAPAVPGQSWCVARSGVPEQYVQAALDYACGIGGADCSTIQQGASCYNPNTMQNHASYAFNSYYQRNPVQTSCDFGGTAFITNVNPSSGACIYPTWSSFASPNTMPPITTNPTSVPTTASSSGATPTSSGTPTVFNPGNPAFGGPAFGGTSTGFGEMPPTANATSTSTSKRLHPLISCIIMVASGNLLWTYRGSH